MIFYLKIRKRIVYCMINQVYYTSKNKKNYACTSMNAYNGHSTQKKTFYKMYLSIYLFTKLHVSFFFRILGLLLQGKNHILHYFGMKDNYICQMIHMDCYVSILNECDRVTLLVLFHQND